MRGPKHRWRTSYFLHCIAAHPINLIPKIIPSVIPTFFEVPPNWYPYCFNTPTPSIIHWFFNAVSALM
jgi:hypothetical protein